MAVNTKDKRFSMLNFGAGSILLPDSDGSFDQGDRQQFLGLYSGILAAGPEVSPVDNWYALIGASIEDFKLIGASVEDFELEGT